MGFVGERKALASALLALYALIFFANAMLVPDQRLVPFLSSLAATYGLAFFSVVAGYFWARWFAIGLGLYGFSTGCLIIWQMGPEPLLVFYALTHGSVSLLLWGKHVAAHFDGRTDWRERFHLDESATHRLGRAVIRVGLSLPFLLAYGLAPRDDAGQMLLAAGTAGAICLGIWGLLRMRTWGLLVIGAGALGVAASALTGASLTALNFDVSGAGLIAAALLGAALAPFAGPAVRFLRDA
ncbi:hypothetical protein [Haliangium ochraceum]|uniref:Uncharacterized protein n=1 Tax=Haliangium ochraceum (strain DSM 14365 / JCM 11303 / SMP-2) TaxID=502025 RepID=D0LV50_HALO1|nr:hypothetical protein [Haliangium ochraceum]ACY15891.1 hypothetical protein Hoch_3389 [Haliangium ochraceum DSM 14365]